MYYLFLAKVQIPIQQILWLLLVRPVLYSVITVYHITKTVLIFHTCMETLVYLLRKTIGKFLQFVYYIPTLGQTFLVNFRKFFVRVYYYLIVSHKVYFSILFISPISNYPINQLHFYTKLHSQVDSL